MSTAVATSSAIPVAAIVARRMGAVTVVGTIGYLTVNAKARSLFLKSVRSVSKPYYLRDDLYEEQQQQQRQANESIHRRRSRCCQKNGFFKDLSMTSRNNDDASAHQLPLRTEHEPRQHASSGMNNTAGNDNNDDFLLSSPNNLDDHLFMVNAERLLRETEREIEDSLSRKTTIATNKLVQDAQIRAIVARRIVDLLIRSMHAMMDYKLHTFRMMRQCDGRTSKSETSTRDDDRPVMASRRGDAPRDDSGTNIIEIDYSALHRKHAKSMREACANHGGLLVKLCQYISTTATGKHLIPKEYIDELSKLQDSCDPLDMEVVEQVLEEELVHKLGCASRLDQVVQWIDPVPLGSASLAQVHRAGLRVKRSITEDQSQGSDDDDDDDTVVQQVALKIQRPHLEQLMAADMLALGVLCNALERVFPELAGGALEWMLPEFHQSVLAELDFEQEARNAERCRKMLQTSQIESNAITAATREPEGTNKRRSFLSFLERWIPQNNTTTKDRTSWAFLVKTATWPKPVKARVVVPETFPELSTSKLLCMSYEEGVAVSNVKAIRQMGIDPKAVAKATCELVAELMLVHGFVHCDTHGGNLLVRRQSSASSSNFDLVLLDHGMYRRLDENFRSGFCHVWAGLVHGNQQQALHGLDQLQLPSDYLDLMGLLLTYRIPPAIVSSLNSRHKSFMDRYLPSFGSLVSPGNNRQQHDSGIRQETKRALRAYMLQTYGMDLMSPAGLNDFLQSQSRDLLYCLRSMSLAKGLNRNLGGSTFSRLLTFGTMAERGIVVAEAVQQDEDTRPQLLTEGPRDELPKTKVEEENNMSDDDLWALADAAKQSLNHPVATELLDSETVAVILRSMTNESEKNVSAFSSCLIPTSIPTSRTWASSWQILWFKSTLLDMWITWNKHEQAENIPRPASKAR